MNTEVVDYTKKLLQFIYSSKSSKKSTVQDLNNDSSEETNQNDNKLDEQNINEDQSSLYRIQSKK